MQLKRPLHISKHPVSVTIYTVHYKIRGTIHVPQHGRISDYLNKCFGGNSKDIFLPITAAECYSLDTDELKFSTKFITIHKDHIHIVIPEEDIAEAPTPSPTPPPMQYNER
jgi:hypothetical protein